MRRLLPVTAAAVLLAGLTACGSTADTDTPAPAASSTSGASGASGSPATTAPLQDLPDPVVTAGIPTDGVDPYSVFGDDVVTAYLEADASSTDQTDAGPACIYTAGGTPIWTLTFAQESLAEFAQAQGGVNVAVVRASGRVVDGGTTCEIAVALTDDTTLQIRWDDQDPGDGCRRTNVVASQAMQNLGAGR